MPADELIDGDRLVLKFKEKARGDLQNNLLFTASKADGGRGSRREKERKIGEVVMKVSSWR